MIIKKKEINKIMELFSRSFDYFQTNGRANEKVGKVYCFFAIYDIHSTYIVWSKNRVLE